MMTTSTYNPWRARHIDAETAFQSGSRRMARTLVDLEYSDAPEPLPCACGAQAYWRATVGAMQCPGCRSLYRSDGALIAREPS